MGTITISIDDDTERRFREAAKKKMGERKGYLGKATTEAFEYWINLQSQGSVSSDALSLLKSPFHLGTHRYSTRNDLYD